MYFFFRANREIILEFIKNSIEDNKYSISKEENKENIFNIIFELKNVFDNKYVSLKLSLSKRANDIEIMKKNIKDFIKEVNNLKKENEELKSKINFLKNNSVLLVPLEHSNGIDKTCPYCGSKNIKKLFALQYKSWQSGVSGEYSKYYLHHLYNSCMKRFFAPDSCDWND